MINPQPPPSIFARIKNNHLLGAIALLLGIVAAIAAVVSAVVDVGGTIDEPTNGPTSSTAPPTPISSSPAPGPSSEEPTSSRPDVSECFDSERAPVDCEEEHRYEVVIGTCSVEEMIRFMGGLNGVDVVVSDVVEVGGRCLLDARRYVEGSAQGVLTTDADDQWRQCVDARIDALVECTTAHTGEYIGARSRGRADLPTCTTAASSYMDQAVANVATDLRVVALKEIGVAAGTARCLIETRGSQRLTASVRNLGVMPVPLER